MNETLIQSNLRSSNVKVRESVFLFLEKSGNITHLKMILEQVKAAATSVNGAIEDDQALLDEVTGLVEYPTAVIGGFDQSFFN